MDYRLKMAHSIPNKIAHERSGHLWALIFQEIGHLAIKHKTDFCQEIQIRHFYADTFIISVNDLIFRPCKSS